MQRSLFIHATNVHQGGGRSLLAAIINSLPSDMKSILSLDSRMQLPEGISQDACIRRVEPSIFQRFFAERWLVKNVVPEDVVLCFGNLPPLFRLRGHVVVFVQNRYLIDNFKLEGFTFKIRLRLLVERLWLSYRIANANEFVVQTPSMKNLLDVLAQGKIPIRVLPFIANHDGYIRKTQPFIKKKEEDFDFLYVASGEPHKNHRQLIESWCLLANEGIFPTLKLTLDEVSFSALCSWINTKITHYKLNIENLGYLHHDHVKGFYEKASALVYPSTFESFGLPLIEARQVGLPILASELDYVRDILDPEQTFDPQSAVSIARAIKRFLRIDESPLPLQDAESFIQNIIKKMA